MKRHFIWALLLAPALARANPHTLPFSYPAATLPKDGLEIEQYVDLTPVKAFDESGALVTRPKSALQTELEYGLTDRLELGLYLTFSDDPGASSGLAPLLFDGVKQRLRWRLGEPGAWPVDVALYGEISELRDELELEGKIIFERQLGPVQLLLNLWAEREFYYSGRREWVANPTAGLSVELSPAVHLGLEYWMHAEFGAGEAVQSFDERPHHFVGPALLVQRGRFWWALAPYLRLDAWNRPSELGDGYGRFYVRSIVGIEL